MRINAAFGPMLPWRPRGQTQGGAMYSMIVMQGRFVPTKEAMRLDTSIDIPLHAPCRPIVRLNNNVVRAY
jgi:hypothetical protein